LIEKIIVLLISGYSAPACE